MLPDATVLRLIDALYEAALRPEQWPVFLSQLSEVLDGRLVAFLHQDTRRRGDDVASLVGIDSTDWRVYAEHFAALNPWISGEERCLQPGLVSLDDEIFPVSSLVRTEFFNDFLKPRRLDHMMGATIGRDGSTFTNLSMHRGRESGPFGQDERQLLERLMPHLQRVVQIHQRLAGAERGRILAEAADHLTAGLLMTDARGRILYANRAAEEMVAGTDGLALVDGQLRAARSEENARLRTLVGATASGEGRDPDVSGGLLRVSRPSGRRPYLLVVAPVRGPREAWLVLERPAAVVFVTDPERQIEPDADMLARAYGLTPAEIRMASRLTAGDSVTDAADVLGVTRETARTHLRNLLQKTDTHRQSELIALLLRSELPRRPPPRAAL